MTTIYVVQCDDLYVVLMLVGVATWFVIWGLLLRLLFDPHRDYPHWLTRRRRPTHEGREASASVFSGPRGRPFALESVLETLVLSVTG